MIYKDSKYVFQSELGLISITCVLGIIHHGEVKAMEEVKTPHGKWWIPMVWACNLLKQAYKEGRISNEISFKALLEVRI